MLLDLEFLLNLLKVF